MALEPQIPMIEQVTQRIHSRHGIARGHYLDDALGEGVADNERLVEKLRILVADLTKSNLSVETSPGINERQRQQLHAAHRHAIALAHRTIAAIEALSGAIITHDLDAEPSPQKTWDNLEDMLTALQEQAA